MSTDNYNNQQNTFISMTIEHAEILAKVLQLIENVKQQQDTLKEDLNDILNTVNGNGEGSNNEGLKITSVIQHEELDKINKSIEHLEELLNEDWLSDSKRFFSEKRQVHLNWKQFLIVGIVQWTVFSIISAIITKLLVKF